MPSVLVSTYSPVQAGSVPAWRSTRNSAGVRRTRHSSSVVGRVVSSVAMLQRYVGGNRRTSGAARPPPAPVGPVMEDASPATFRPTWQQAFGRGLYLGGLPAVAGVTAAMPTLAVGLAPPPWLWPLLAFGPPSLGALIGLVVGRRTGTQICAGGIRTLSVFTDGLAPWSRIVDLRAERRGARTVVSVYLDSGASVQLQAPYSGGLFAADPQFERKVFALSHLWRSHRFGGLPG